jgi:hypothetical protein
MHGDDMPFLYDIASFFFYFIFGDKGYLPREGLPSHRVNMKVLGDWLS